ncbi:unnamed protein product [Cunninghamella blakesleeana]
MATLNHSITTTTMNPSDMNQQASTHDKKKCTSASCCSPSRLWKSIQQFLSQQDKEGLMALCQDEEKQVHVLRVLLTSRYHNDPARYGASNKHLVLNLADKMSGANTTDNTALNLSNTIKRRKLVYERFGKPLTDLNALQLAILYRNEEVVLALLDVMVHHATKKEFHSFLSHQCGKQISSLHLAGFLALPKVVEKLLSFGMDPQLKNGRMKTPLDCTDHSDCRQLLELAMLPPPSLDETMILSDSESESMSCPTTPTVEMNLIDLDVLVTPFVMENEERNISSTPIVLMEKGNDLDLSDTWMMSDVIDLNENQVMKKSSFGLNLDLTDTWMMYMSKNKSMTIDLDLTDTWIMNTFMNDHYQIMMKHVYDVDWLTSIALNDTWLMDTLKQDQDLSSSMNVTTTKTSDLNEWNLNGTWMVHLKEMENGSSSSPHLTGTWFMHLKEKENVMDSFSPLNGTWFTHLKEIKDDSKSCSLSHLYGTWFMHLKEKNASSSSSLPSPHLSLDDTWLMAIWKETHVDQLLNPLDSKQPSLPALSMMHLMKQDEVLATPPLSPTQEEDDYDDNESMNLDELPELELNDDTCQSLHADDHGGNETLLMPLLFNMKDHPSSEFSFNDQQHQQKDEFDHHDFRLTMNPSHDLGVGDMPSHLVMSSHGSKMNDDSNSSTCRPLKDHSTESISSLSILNQQPSPTLSSFDDDGNHDHGDSKRSFSSLPSSPPNLSSHLNSGGTTTSHQHHLHPHDHHQEPPNDQNKQDHRAVHFDPKVVLMEICSRGDLKELMDTFKNLSQDDLSSWLLNHHGDAGVHDRTLLQLALLNGHEKIIHYLVNHVNMNVNQVDANGWTALHYAIALGHWKMAEYLASLHLTDLFAQTDDGYLYEDCTRSRLDRIRCQWLLDRAMMNHSLYTTHHPHLHTTLTSLPTTSPLMCG